MTTILRNELVLVTDGGTLQHRSADGVTLIEWKPLDGNNFNRPRGMCIGGTGETYVCMDRISSLIPPGGGPTTGQPGIIKFSANFATQTYWNNPSTMFMSGGGPAPYQERWPMDIDELPDGTFIVIAHERSNTAPTTPVDQRRQVALYHMAANGTLITIWHNILCDFDSFNGIGTFIPLRVSRDCVDPNIVWYTHTSQSLFKFNLTTGIGTRWKTINRLLPFDFGDLAPLPGGGVLVAMTRGPSTGTFNNPFSVPSSWIFGVTATNHTRNTFGPQWAITPKSGLSPTTFFGDEGTQYQHTPENKYYFDEYVMTDGAVVTQRIVQQPGISANNNQAVHGMDVYFDT